MAAVGEPVVAASDDSMVLHSMAMDLALHIVTEGKAMRTLPYNSEAAKPCTMLPHTPSFFVKRKICTARAPQQASRHFNESETARLGPIV